MPDTLNDDPEHQGTAWRRTWMREGEGRARGPEDDARRSTRLSPRERRAGAEEPLVTVVIPCYNQAHFLGEAIESVLSQTYPHHEIVVVDDGSTDDTSEVASRYPSVRLIRQENRGLSAARNAGLAQSRGEHVVFLDSDDRLLPEALEVGVRELEAHPRCAFVFGRWNNIAMDGSARPTPHRPHVERDHYLTLLHSCHIRMHAVVYRKSIFETVGGFDTSLSASEDYDMYLRIARDHPVHYHGEVVAEYRRRHGANMTGNPALILSTSVTVHRSQHRHIRGHKQYEEAYNAGMKRRQRTHGDHLVGEVKVRVREREWKRALQGMLVLLRFYPQGLALLWLHERRIERIRLVRRLQAREQDLEMYERRLEESGGTSKKERREVHLLRERIRRLERRIRDLDRQA
jgi:glycosyltransferase involved in cell wall biosynthesis